MAEDVQQDERTPPSVSPVPSTDERAMLEQFLKEEDDAYADVRRTEDEPATLKRLCQAIFWACALDEWLEKNRATYRSFAETDECWEVLSGIRWARNRAIHQFQNLLYLTGGATLPIEWPAVFFEYKWRPAGQLPPPDKPYQEKGRAEYEKRLAKLPARFALGDLVAFFERARKGVP